MGYKLAGFEHLGGVEIDKQVARIYKTNHHPKYLFIEDIRAFNNRSDLPDELYQLDILDGSPPCSSFSTSGIREKDWGKEKKFREGQAHQRLDDLFFEFIATAKKLKPKAVIAENVKGLILGNARYYLKRIKEEFEAAGYRIQIFLLNAASMGVPQKRERVFFICRQADLDFPDLKFYFREAPIPFSTVDAAARKFRDEYKTFTPLYEKYWHRTKPGKAVGLFNSTAKRLVWHKTANTLTASSNYGLCHPVEVRPCSKNELILVSSFPLDYEFGDLAPHYLMGMSVPPVMTAQIVHQIWLQWFSTEKN